MVQRKEEIMSEEQNNIHEFTPQMVEYVRTKFRLFHNGQTLSN